MSLRKLTVMLCLLALANNLFGQATEKPQQLAASIAQRIISETPYTFINKATKRTYTSLKGVPQTCDIRVQNQYNDWHYTNGVLHIALLELADLTKDAKYEEYVWKNMNFIFDKDNLGYFEKQYNEAFSEGGWRAIRRLSWHMIFRNKRLDDNGPMGASLIDLQMRRPHKAFKEYIQTTEHHLMVAEPRLEDGTIARLWPHENTIWADDLFMAVSFLCRMGKMTGDVKYFDDAANQVLNYHKYLWHPEKEIYYHCYHTDVKEHGVAHWSRANGWMLMAQADLLTMLPDNHPQKEALIENFKRQVIGVLQYQGRNGLWYQVLDKVDSYEEITGTSMFVFAIARGVRMGWINKDYIYAAEQGLKGMMTKMTDKGDVTAICVGTGIMPSVTFYYNRPTQENAPMGEGPVLRALVEMAYAKKYTEVNADEQYDKITSCAPEAVKSGYIEVDNGSLYYEELGKGEPLILVHGHSLDRRMWDMQFREFAKHYRVIRYDVRGYGLSSSQSETYQFTHAADLVRLMDALGIAQAHIVGLSMGGFIGADMLGCYPERVKSAVLASGNIRKSPGPSQPMGEEEAAKRDKEIAELMAKGVDVMKQEWFEGLMSSGGTQRERMRAPLWQMIQDWGAWQPLHKEVRVIVGLDAYAALKEKQPEVPVLLVEGNAPGNRYSESPEILRYLPNGKQVVLDDCGHMLNMEQPEAFNSVVLEFLR